MSEELDYIKDSFTKTEDNVNLEVDNIDVSCITSKNNNFNLDSEGNLTVKSINASEGVSSNLSIDSIYPVGSIYISVNATNPGSVIGGVWEQLKDRFLLGAGDTYNNGATGGASTHTLTASQMPIHAHNQNVISNYGYPNPFVGYDANICDESQRLYITGGFVTGGTWVAKDGYQNQTNAVGGGQAHNNMPPYLVVYMWKRTA